MTDRQRPKIVFHKPPSDSANPYGMRRPIIPLKRTPPANNPADIVGNTGYRHDMRGLPLHERPVLPLKPPTSDTDPTPPTGTERPTIKLSDADKNAKPKPKVTSFKKDRPIIKLKED